ncbi:MAG TPA: hypothetical protein VFQ79_20985, partial [Bryobacteraceae bacterium]|nr:hypothetical protein [Bryobacteraceae bacterium]
MDRCGYSMVFVTPVNPARHPLLRKYPNAPHPFVLVPPAASATLLSPGTAMTARVTLIGNGAVFLPHFIRVFEAMGASGRYGGAFHLEDIVSPLDPGCILYDPGSRILRRPPVWSPPETSAPVSRI